ncbi:hypothetical protein SARC_03488 [Sphaeroforma arctica JP610]|uniref:Uncharacterized protein n=1 Tax=Sphaeroforma arctica JP610 TaxID=667725 RepID=A0A0L0G5H3_9EUKA|nr:hypothetical protein SARC_03488 [Sphaeroforma arctica JP610]KNC84287.1 hypothetical protein SARC_03488 [Sphaeroforma arctica JP610]|eukprot:XP_014158189.1 hypothetical protein SARC_03488 [Sphaeroforma arctica JP610]
MLNPESSSFPNEGGKNTVETQVKASSPTTSTHAKISAIETGEECVAEKGCDEDIAVDQPLSWFQKIKANMMQQEKRQKALTCTVHRPGSSDLMR